MATVGILVVVVVGVAVQCVSAVVVVLGGVEQGHEVQIRVGREYVLILVTAACGCWREGWRFGTHPD